MALAGGLGFLGFSNVQMKIVAKMDDALVSVRSPRLSKRATPRKGEELSPKSGPPYPRRSAGQRV